MKILLFVILFPLILGGLLARTVVTALIAGWTITDRTER